MLDWLPHPHSTCFAWHLESDSEGSPFLNSDDVMLSGSCYIISSFNPPTWSKEIVTDFILFYFFIKSNTLLSQCAVYTVKSR